MHHHKSYVLVTAARNEAAFIERTIQSVIAQSIKPRAWIIVSDRSVDATDEIVGGYAQRHPFIHLVRNEAPSSRDTAAKVRAINIGFDRLRPVEYAYIGNLDADVSFGETYFEALMENFEADKELGVIGGRIFQAIGTDGKFVETNSSEESVAGATQFFRRECFEQIGGYQPIPGGMEDGVAETTARYHGWKTCSFGRLPVYHHRGLGTVGRSVLKARFSNGMTEYVVGFSSIYHLIRSLSRVSEKPYLAGSILLTAGYLWGSLTRRSRIVPDPIMRFLRQEQMNRLKGKLFGKMAIGLSLDRG
jgi:poly-beta-1,6-N-acetyl-D-glucosamine synthase